MATRWLPVHLGPWEWAGNHDALLVLGRQQSCPMSLLASGPALELHPGCTNTRRLHGTDNATGCTRNC